MLIKGSIVVLDSFCFVSTSWYGSTPQRWWDSLAVPHDNTGRCSANTSTLDHEFFAGCHFQKVMKTVQRVAQMMTLSD